MAQEERKGKGSAWPWVFTVILLCGIIWCAYEIWTRHQTAVQESRAQLAALEGLRQKREDLKKLLALTPCEAREKMEESRKTAPAAMNPGPAAANVTRAPDEIERACVFLAARSGNKAITTGSGFFVAPGRILTNRHVVEQARGAILVTSRALGHPVPGRIAAAGRGPTADYALISIDQPANANIAIMSFGATPQKTARVGAWGFPDLLGKADPQYEKLMHGDITAVPELSYTEGVVSAVLPGEAEIIAHTAPISPGNSGGPLVDADGNVVGINTMITLDKGSYRQASLALAVGELLDFLAAQGIQPVKK